MTLKEHVALSLFPFFHVLSNFSFISFFLSFSNEGTGNGTKYLVQCTLSMFSTN